VKQLDG
jgi:hypothetical protein